MLVEIKGKYHGNLLPTRCFVNRNLDVSLNIIMLCILLVLLSLIVLSKEI